MNKIVHHVYIKPIVPIRGHDKLECFYLNKDNYMEFLKIIECDKSSLCIFQKFDPFISVQPAFSFRNYKFGYYIRFPLDNKCPYLWRYCKEEIFNKYFTFTK